MAPFTIPVAAAKMMASLGCSLRIELFGLWLLSIGLCLLYCRCSLCIGDRCYLESSAGGFETIASNGFSLLCKGFNKVSPLLIENLL